MAHSHSHSQAEEKLHLGPGARTFMVAAAVIGVVGLLAAFLTSSMMGGTGGGIRRFWFAYLIGFAYFLSLAIGGLFFVLVQYVVRAGWSINVRRVPEAMARTLPLFLILAIPLIFSILRNDGALYRWAQPAAGHHAEGHGAVAGAHATTTATAAGAGQHGAQNSVGGEVEKSTHGGAPQSVGVQRANHDGVAEAASQGQHGEHAGQGVKRVTDDMLGNTPGAYPIQDPLPLTAEGKPLPPDSHLVGPKKKQFLLLSTPGVITKMILSIGALSLIAYWYTGWSRRQDGSGDPALTRTLNIRAAPMLIIFGVSVTAIAFDFIMSLDPKWFSTMFGPYYFAGAAISVHATTILVLSYLKGQGYLKNSVGRDHFHDLGKWLFAFTFFWGYLAFSQYMLLWYSAQPEEIEWVARRGASTAHTHLNTFGAYTVVAMVVLFGKLLIPFGGLLSRHVKRNHLGLIFWASWCLLAHAVDIFWLVMPELDGKFHFGLPEITAFLGIGGLFAAGVTWALSGAALRPIRDPRAPESLAFHQSF